jgi:5-methylcytosine-specific restriction endonuclease McrA
VNDEILVLCDDDGATRRGIVSDQLVGGYQQATIRHVLGIVTQGLKTPRERRRELRIHQEAQSDAPQDGMIILPRGELQHGRNVLGFEIGIVREDFVCGRTGSQQVEHVLDPDAKPANAWATAADFRFCRDPLNGTQVVAPPSGYRQS